MKDIEITSIFIIAALLLLALIGAGIVLYRKRKLEITKKIEPSLTRPEIATPPPSALSAWQAGLKKSRDPLLARLHDAFASLSGQEKWGEAHPLWERLEESLLAADLGPRMTEILLSSLKEDFREAPTEEALKAKLRQRMEELLEKVPAAPALSVKPSVTLLIGVNGAGKTTTAGKLGSQAKLAGRKVILGAADTFRAAAVEQLKMWAQKIGVECIEPAAGANPAAVAFDTVAAGLARDADEIIIDTAGRLHTKDNLMEELKKVARVVDKKIPGAPHQVLLVLDASLGQNAIHQAKEFTSAIPTTGVVLTKLDGSARGGAAFTVTAELGLPIAYVGLGERAEDLRPFSVKEFVENLLP